MGNEGITPVWECLITLSQLKFRFNFTLTTNLYQLSQVFLKSTVKEMRFVFKGSSSVLDKVANISIILIFIQSVNESQEGTNRAALCGQSTRLLHGLPADEKLMRANSVLPLYLNRFGTWQSQSHVQSGTASTWTWLACQSNPPLPRATKKAGCPFVLNWKKY